MKHILAKKIFTLPLLIFGMAVFPITSCTKTITFNISKVNIIGSIDELSSKSDKAKVQIEFKDINHVYDFTTDATIKWQGDSTLLYPKKNFNIELFKSGTSYTEPIEKKVCQDWGLHSKYTLKANYNDTLMLHNVVSAKLYGDLVHSRSDSDDISQLLNGGAIDGFPIALYNNNEFIGCYNFNLKKDKYLYNMEEGQGNCAMLFAHDWTLSTSFREIIADDLSNGWEIEYCSTSSTDWVKTSFNNFINFVMTANDSEFKNNIGYFSYINRLIDYALFVDVGLLLDNKDNNIMWVTYDGMTWYPGLYDIDCSWGYDPGIGYWPTSAATDLDRSLLFERLKLSFHDEMKSRYWELRNSIFKSSYLINKFKTFYNLMPTNLIEADKKKWPDALWWDINNMDHAIDWLNRRFNFMDVIWG